MKDTIYQQNPDCLIEDMDGELLMYNPATAVTLHLNESSAYVWESCDGERTVQDIIGGAQQAFPDQAEQIEEDILSVVTDLVTRKALRAVEE